MIKRRKVVFSIDKAKQKAFEKRQEIEKNYSNIKSYYLYNFKDYQVEFVNKTLKEMAKSDLSQDEKLIYIADKIKKEFDFKWSKIEPNIWRFSNCEINFKRKDFIGSQPHISIHFKK